MTREMMTTRAKLKTMVVGDLHGDWCSLNQLINQKQPNLVLQCGDFGWWPKLECKRPVLYGQQTSWKLKGIKAPNTTVLWCDGNHEDHWYLRDNPKLINYDKVIYQPRGSVNMLSDGRVVMFIGGAESVDKDQRTLGIDWFPEEVISYEEGERCLSYIGKVDIVVSHTCPLEFDVGGNEAKRNDPTRKLLSAVLEKYKPDLWYFGHWHKHKEGKHLNTRWTCLDYPKHVSRWWMWVP